MNRSHCRLITLLLCGVLGGGTVSGLAPIWGLSRAWAAEPVRLERSEAWAPLAIAAPVTGRTSDDSVSIDGNGTRTCCVGWQFLWGRLILAACDRQPDLIVTHATVIGGKGLVEGTVTVPGPAMKPFQTITREHKVHLVLGTKQRDGDAYYNSSVVIGHGGEIVGVYHKVHLDS